MTATRSHYHPLSFGLRANTPTPVGHSQEAYVSTDGIYVSYSTGHVWQDFMAHAGSEPPPPDPIPDQPPWSAPTPAFFVDTDYETETSGYFDQGFGANASYSTLNPHHGSRHFRDTITGTSHASGKGIAGVGSGNGVRQIAFRDWFYLSNLPNVNNQYLILFSGPGTSFSVRCKTNGQLLAATGSTVVNLGSPITAAAWHVLDGVCDVSGSTFSFTVKVDGGTETVMTSAGEPGDFTKWQYDQSGGNTITIDHDQLRLHNTASHYPLSDA